MKTRTQRLVAGMSKRMNRLRMLANDKGFTLIELMIVIAIIGILAAVAIPRFIEYKNKSYCTATVNDVGAIGGALADYFANPANVTATTRYNHPTTQGIRPSISIGGPDYIGTLLLSLSTTMPGATTAVPTSKNINGAAAGAYRDGSNYVVYACEGARNCPQKITSSNSHWVDNPISRKPCTPGSTCCYFKTL